MKNDKEELIEFAKYVYDMLYRKDKHFTLYKFNVEKQDFLGNFFVVEIKVLVKDTLYDIIRFVEVSLEEGVFEKIKGTLESDFEKF